jgi:hypothetical protein
MPGKRVNTQLIVRKSSPICVQLTKIVLRSVLERCSKAARRHQRTHTTQDNPFAHSSTLASAQGMLNERASEPKMVMKNVSVTATRTLGVLNQNINYWLGSTDALKFSWAQTWPSSPAHGTLATGRDAGSKQ